MPKDNLLKHLSHPSNFFITVLGFCSIMLVPLFTFSPQAQKMGINVAKNPLALDPAEVNFEVVDPEEYEKQATKNNVALNRQQLEEANIMVVEPEQSPFEFSLLLTWGPHKDLGLPNSALRYLGNLNKIPMTAYEVVDGGKPQPLSEILSFDQNSWNTYSYEGLGLLTSMELSSRNLGSGFFSSTVDINNCEVGPRFTYSKSQEGLIDLSVVNMTNYDEITVTWNDGTVEKVINGNEVWKTEKLQKGKVSVKTSEGLPCATLIWNLGK